MTTPTIGNTQDKINDLYSNLEIEANILEGVHFTGQRWKDSFAQARYLEIHEQMRYLAKEHNATSLPF